MGFYDVNRSRRSIRPRKPLTEIAFGDEWGNRPW